jgi:Arc/MetJ-type ribon-helix-helix transcriptional regulator
MPKTTPKNQSQTVNITLPKGLLKRIDALAKRDYTSRSDFIRQSVLGRVRQVENQELDEFGDPKSENWKNIIDFRELGYPDGMPAEEFIARIEALNGQSK